jgi:hypothetical protein
MSELKEIVKKIGFSDKFGVITSIVVGVFCFCCLAAFTFLHKETIAFMISAVGFEGTLIGFLYTKNRVENKAKIETWGNPNQEGIVEENDTNNPV